jgi:glycosyltransferase involved in cell wall biosynthesis
MKHLLEIGSHQGSAVTRAATTPRTPGLSDRISRFDRIAIVHDWCPAFRGGERVLSHLCKVFPNADIYTLFDFLTEDIKEEFFYNVMFHTSIANQIPYIQKFYKQLFFVCPFLIEQFDVTSYDAVVSSSAAFARGVLTRPDQPHLCYVHSPARYAWDEQFSYLEHAKLGFGPQGLLYRWMLHHIRTWDTRTAHGPDLMLANSRYVRGRIRQIYGRDAQVVHPPVDVRAFECVADKEDYFVTASYFAPYKRTDLVVEAFAKMPNRKLVVIGEGQDALRVQYSGNVHFTGRLASDEYIRVVSRARAMVFAGCEDFGIALAEAQACGTPLIAYGRGGARDIVRALAEEEHPTGILFAKQTIGDIQQAIESFEKNAAAILPKNCSANAARFSSERFEAEIAHAFDTAQLLHVSRW